MCRFGEYFSTAEKNVFCCRVDYPVKSIIYLVISSLSLFLFLLLYNLAIPHPSLVPLGSASRGVGSLGRHFIALFSHGFVFVFCFLCKPLKSNSS